MGFVAFPCVILRTQRGRAYDAWSDSRVIGSEHAETGAEVQYESEGLRHVHRRIEQKNPQHPNLTVKLARPWWAEQKNPGRRQAQRIAALYDREPPEIERARRGPIHAGKNEMPLMSEGPRLLEHFTQHLRANEELGDRVVAKIDQCEIDGGPILVEHEDPLGHPPEEHLRPRQPFEFS
jgi:hypothetical protein